MAEAAWGPRFFLVLATITIVIANYQRHRDRYQLRRQLVNGRKFARNITQLQGALHSDTICRSRGVPLTSKVALFAAVVNATIIFTDHRNRVSNKNVIDNVPVHFFPLRFCHDPSPDFHFAGVISIFLIAASFELNVTSDGRKGLIRLLPIRR